MGFNGFTGGTKVYKKYTATVESAFYAYESLFWKWKISTSETFDAAAGVWSYTVNGTLSSAGIDGWPSSGTFAVSSSDPTRIEIVGNDGTRYDWGRFRSAANPSGVTGVDLPDATNDTDYISDETRDDDDYERFAAHVETEYTDAELEGEISAEYAEAKALFPSLDWNMGVTVEQGVSEIGGSEIEDSPAYRVASEPVDYPAAQISGGQYRLKITSVGNRTIRWAEVTVPDDIDSDTTTHTYEETVNVTTGDGAYTSVHTIEPPDVLGETFIRILSSQLLVNPSSSTALNGSQGRLFQTGAIFKGSVAEIVVNTLDLSVFSSAIVTYAADDGFVKLMAIDPAVEEEEGLDVALEAGYEIPSGADLLADTNRPGFTGMGGWKLVAVGLKTGSATIQVSLANTIDTAPAVQTVTVTVYPQVDLAVDANRDGAIKFPSDDASDRTSTDKPYRFWLNNDVDRHNQVDTTLGFGGYDLQDDLDPSLPQYQGHLDCDLDTVPGTRDLEDYTRLWINLNGLQDTIASGDFAVGLKWVGNLSSGNTPAIKLIRAVEADGGARYLTDNDTAANQIANTQGNALVDASGSTTLIQPTAGVWDFLIPKAALGGISADDPTAHFLFEGCQRGQGQLTIVLLQKSGATYTKIGDGPGVYLDLRDIKEMYQRWTVGENNGGLPKSSSTIADKRLPAGVGGMAADVPLQDYEQNQYILYVHGWNMQPWEKDAFAETAYKRLYWQGYKGRFGTFQWPTTYGDAFDAIQGSYDNGEYTAWRSAAPLAAKLADLSSSYSGNVYVLAHSMGNVVTGEALRLAAQGGSTNLVKAYVATEAAVPGEAWDPALATSAPLQYAVGRGPDTPDVYLNWMLSDHATTTSRVNFFNTADYALNIWQINETLKPDFYFPSVYYYADSNLDSPGDFFKTSVATDPVTAELIIKSHTGVLPTKLNLGNPASATTTDRYKIFAYAGEPRSLALGGTSGSIFGFSSLNLGSAPADSANPSNIWPTDTLSGNRYSAHPWHSAQFRFANMDQNRYWNSLLNAFQLIGNNQ